MKRENGGLELMALKQKFEMRNSEEEIDTFEDGSVFLSLRFGFISK